MLIERRDESDRVALLVRVSLTVPPSFVPVISVFSELAHRNASSASCGADGPEAPGSEPPCPGSIIMRYLDQLVAASTDGGVIITAESDSNVKAMVSFFMMYVCLDGYFNSAE